MAFQFLIIFQSFLYLSFKKNLNTEIIDVIKPKQIYHLQPCQRKITIKIPDSYVSSGKVPKKIYDAGTVELAGKFKGEERDCLN